MKNLTKLSEVVARAVRAIDIEDALTFAGTVAVGVGVWQIHPSAGLIVVGVALLYLGLWHGPLIARLVGRR